ncbi:MAG TPA: hypothetical protein ENK43_17460 [Planctomycetes bacterium]|nr:hypothetical protein [Planctomycetota bacterium]
MTRDDSCRFVEDYLGRFAGRQDELDHEAISDHVKTCSSCYELMSAFFQNLDVPESGYIRETVDDLTLSLYNLAKALMRQPAAKEEDPDLENVLFVSNPDASPDHYKEEAVEITEDVEDFTGRDDFRGASMEGMRNLMARSRREVDLLLSLLDRGIALEGQYSWDCRNLKAILLLTEERLEDAERELRAILALRGADVYLRSVQVHAMNNLSYVCSMKGDLGEALKWATRSRVLAEECNLDPVPCRFSRMFFLLKRDGPGDRDAAREEVRAILERDGGLEELQNCLALPSNKEIRELFVAKGLARDFPRILPPKMTPPESERTDS